MRKKILFLSPSARIGGAEHSLLKFVEFLKDSKAFDPLVILPRGGQLTDRLRDMDVPVIHLPKWLIEAHSILELLIAPLFIWFIVRKYRIDIIHANSKFCSRLAIWSGWLTRKKTILHWRDFSLWPDEKRYLNKFKDRLKIITVSQSIQKFLIENGAQVKDISVLYDAIDEKYLLPVDAEVKKKIAQEYSITDDDLVFAITGRIDSWKGHKLLLRALGEIKDLKFKLLISGEYHKVNNPAIEEEIKALIARYKMEDKVRFIGFRKDMEKILSIVDVVVVPSDFEPLGMVALEAMASGTPVIASDTGGLSETVLDGKTGFLFKLKDLEDLKNKIVKILQNKNELKSIGEKAKSRYTEMFSNDIVKKKYLEMYEFKERK